MGLLDFFKSKQYLYKGCSDLLMTHFDIITKTNDLRYLVVGYDGYGDIKIPKGAEKRWKEIRKEWVELTDSNTLAYYYNLLSELTYLETRYAVVKMLLHQIYIRNMNEKTLDMYIEMLGRWRYKYKKEEDKYDNLQRLLNQHKASTNKLGLKRDEIKKMQEDFKENEDTLDKQIVAVEQVIGRSIDKEKLTVLKWHELVKVAKEINEKRARNGR